MQVLREIRVHVLLTQKESDEIKALAEKTGEGIGPFIRRLALQHVRRDEA